MDINFNINLTARIEPGPVAAGKLDKILTALGEVMSIAKDIKDLTNQLNEATNAVAARLDRLSGQIKNSMTDEEVAAAKADLGALRDHLTQMGQDPADPIPTPEPPPADDSGTPTNAAQRRHKK